MLDKGTELFLFEGDFFKLKKRYIDADMTEEMWAQLFKECDELCGKYNFGELYFFYCLEHVMAFLDFLVAKQDKNYNLERVRRTR